MRVNEDVICKWRTVQARPGQVYKRTIWQRDVDRGAAGPGQQGGGLTTTRPASYSFGILTVLLIQLDNQRGGEEDIYHCYHCYHSLLDPFLVDKGFSKIKSDSQTVLAIICVSELYLKQYVINISRCLNVTRKADWTFLNNLATFGGFLFSYFHRFTIGIPAQVIILGPFTSQVAVTSIYGGQTVGVHCTPSLL